MTYYVFTVFHWILYLGNDYLYELTNMFNRTYQLLIQLSDFDTRSIFALYSRFRIASEQDNYALTLGSMFGSSSGNRSCGSAQPNPTMVVASGAKFDGFEKNWVSIAEQSVTFLKQAYKLACKHLIRKIFDIWITKLSLKASSSSVVWEASMGMDIILVAQGLAWGMKTAAVVCQILSWSDAKWLNR